MVNSIWSKRSQEEIKEIVFSALDNNVNYDKEQIIGIPASFLDDKVFNQDASFLKDAPFISCLVQNPNHIGCHTLGKSESFFKGTQQIEKELLDICAVDVLKCARNAYDGYVASGGTEANIQAIWIYRNFFLQKHQAKREEICILCSEDSHYSMDKAANLLSIDIHKVPVRFDDRKIIAEEVEKAVLTHRNKGKKHFIVVCNMMTTMFGSVDDVNIYSEVLEEHSISFKLHVDAAYGGFYYPFTESQSKLTFENRHIDSFTLDAHKMAQAPYGTGVFLIRKGLINYVNTQEAQYVEGEDFTLIGSRSGANAIATWMILVKTGLYGWQEKVFILQKRTEWLCNELEQLNIQFYRHPRSNIITIRSHHLSKTIVKKFGLVPDNYQNPQWYKIVLMEHVIIEKLMMLIEEIGSYQKS